MNALISLLESDNGSIDTEKEGITFGIETNQTFRWTEYNISSVNYGHLYNEELSHIRPTINMIVHVSLEGSAILVKDRFPAHCVAGIRRRYH